MLYYMLNKPQGYITAKSDEKHHTVMEFFPQELQQELFPVGRLDKDTEGLLLFTNDGQFNQRLMHPKHHATKTYFFYAFGEINEEKKRAIEEGLMLDGEEKVTKAAWLTILDSGIYENFQDCFTLRKRLRDNEYNRTRPVFSASLVITEGRKHQVKRMLAAVGCRIVYLKRTAIGALCLDDTLPLGEYRILSEEDIKKTMLEE